MNNGRIFYLYLGGPILGTDYSQCTDWRNYTADKLPPHIQAISPMRGKKELDTGGSIESDDLKKHPLCTPKRLTTRDRHDVLVRADALLMNLLGVLEVSKGSMIEIGWGDAFRKPIIVVMEPDNIHNHPMVEEIAGFITTDLDEAIAFVISLFSN